MVLLLVLFCSSSALADTFGLGTAGPGNWGILETGANQVSLSNNTGITVNSGATSSQANLGINSGGKLNQSGTVVVQGTYYKFSTNSDSTTSGFTAVGGVNTTSNSNSRQPRPTPQPLLRPSPGSHQTKRWEPSVQTRQSAPLFRGGTWST